MNKSFDRDQLLVKATLQSGEVRLRFPSDEDWVRRFASQKLIKFRLGRGKTRDEVLCSEEFDNGLVEKYMDHPIVSLARGEARRLLDALEVCAPVDVEPELGHPGIWRIVMRPIGYETAHLLREPTTSEIRAHRDARRALDRERNEGSYSIIRYNIQPSVEIYDQLKIGTVGYASSVPVGHKSIAADSLLTTVCDGQRPRVVEELNCVR
jgi:hypothetical protein